MKRLSVSVRSIFLAFSILLSSCSTKPVALPEQSARASEPVLAASEQDASALYGELFERVQLAPVFEDSKHFVDMVPKSDVETVMKAFHAENPKTKDELSRFVARHFNPPVAPSTPPGKTTSEIDQHIKSLWSQLERKPDDEPSAASSLIPLPHSYVVPGGRFREIYYWDSYFTQLGLLADGQEDLFKNMVLNFAHLLEKVGRIPNGNRDYYRGRSQPPFFSHMVALWRDRFGAESASRFLPELLREHEFWMSGERAVKLPDGAKLNRYWDDTPAPRPEAYKEDRALAERAAQLGRPPEQVYRDLRAGAESGWDYSTRWFIEPTDFATIETTSFLPVDLNCLLYHLEATIAELAKIKSDGELANRFQAKAQSRRDLIQRHMWDQASGTYRDFDWRRNKQSDEVTVATVAPLFVGIATKDQAVKVAKAIERDFLKPGGVVTTKRVSGQQWDAPNGWPPHQWMTFAALKLYGIDSTAEQLRKRWLDLNRRVFRSTGKMMEKYDVVDLGKKSGGGEYPTQDGFGWTNGVFRALSTPHISIRHLRSGPSLPR